MIKIGSVMKIVLLLFCCQFVACSTPVPVGWHIDPNTQIGKTNQQNKAYTVSATHKHYVMPQKANAPVIASQENYVNQHKWWEYVIAILLIVIISMLTPSWITQWQTLKAWRDNKK